MNKLSILFLILVLVVNSILLNKKLKNIENFKIVYSDDEYQRQDVDKLKKQSNILQKNVNTLNTQQTTAFSKLLDFISGEKSRKEKEQKSMVDQMKKKDPLNNFEKKSGLSCKNIQIGINDTVSSHNPNISNSIIKKGCADTCNKDRECISFDYNSNNNTCRLSRFCYVKNAKRDNNSEIYLKKGAKIPSISKFNLHGQKSMRGHCLRSKKDEIPNSNMIKCADKCFRNANCISWELNKIKGSRKNVCKTYTKCHNHTMKDDKSSIVGTKLNVIKYGIPGPGAVLRTRPS